MESTKKKITFKKAIELGQAVYAPNLDSNKRDRLSMHIVQLREYLKSPAEQYNKKLLAIEQELCSVDSNGDFYLDSKNIPIYSKFNKTNQKIRDERVQKLLEEEVDIEYKYCTDFSRIKTLHLSFIYMFNGYLFDLSQEQIEEFFILPDEPEKKEDKKD